MVNSIDYAQAYYGGPSRISPWGSTSVSQSSSGIPTFAWNSPAPAFGYSSNPNNVYSSPKNWFDSDRAFAVAEAPAAYSSQTETFESDMDSMYGSGYDGLSDTNVDWSPVKGALATAQSAVATKDSKTAHDSIVAAWTYWMRAPDDATDSAGGTKAAYMKLIGETATKINQALPDAEAPTTAAEAQNTGPSTAEKLFGGLISALPGIATVATQAIASKNGLQLNPATQTQPASAQGMSTATMAILGIAGVAVAYFVYKEVTKK